MTSPVPVPVLVSRVGPVGIIELAQPKALNALSRAAFELIESALDGFERRDAGVRAVLVRAQGKHFCAGADLKEARSLISGARGIDEFLQVGHRVLQRMEQSDLPVVAACQGLALAGGVELLMACDVVFASSDARFGDQHAQYGLLPGWGGSQRLTRLIGLRRSLDLFFSAAWVDAPTARQWGLVNHVVAPEQLGDLALAYCVKLSGRSRTGIAAMKRLARQGLDKPLAEGLEMEREAARRHLGGPDVAEGLAAFDAHREPVFKE